MASLFIRRQLDAKRYEIAEEAFSEQSDPDEALQAMYRIADEMGFDPDDDELKSIIDSAWDNYWNEISREQDPWVPTNIEVMLDIASSYDYRGE